MRKAPAAATVNDINTGRTEIPISMAAVTAIGIPSACVGIPELLLVNITVSLFAGIVPIPGGIGVVEGALIFGLARHGVPEEAASAASKHL